MKILGIDPGSTRAGYGVIDFNAKNNTAEYLDGGIISVSSKEENQRLLELKKSTEEVIRKHKPEVAGIEKIYFNKNVKTAKGKSMFWCIIDTMHDKRDINY